MNLIGFFIGDLEQLLIRSAVVPPSSWSDVKDGWYDENEAVADAIEKRATEERG